VIAYYYKYGDPNDLRYIARFINEEEIEFISGGKNLEKGFIGYFRNWNNCEWKITDDEDEILAMLI